MQTNAWCAESGQLNFVGSAGAGPPCGQEVVRVAEQGERRRPLRIRGHHVQRLLADLVRQVERDWGRRAALVRVDRLRRGDVTLELAERRVRARRVAVHVDRRRRVVVHGEVRLAARDQREQVRVHLSDLVRGTLLARVDVAERVAPRAVARVAAGEVVVLVGREHEQRVLLRDPVTLQAREEGRERLVVLVERLYVVVLARAGCPREDAVRVRRGRERVLVVVVRVRDVPERDRDAGLLHLRDVAERHLCGHAVEARESRLAERVRDRVAVRVVDRRAAVVDRRVDVLRAEEALEARVATGLVGQGVGLRVLAVVADPAGRRRSGS